MSADPSSKSDGALRWGLIGASNIARQRVIGGIRQAGGVIQSVYSTDRARGEAYAAENGIPHFAPTLDAVLRDVDAVYISTTNERHRAQVIASATAGRHVLCEKPLSISLDDTRSMIEACRAKSVVLATNHHLRSNAVHRAMRTMIAEGHIGRPLFARIFNAGYLPENLQSWRVTSADAGAGVILDKLVHDVDTLRLVLGEEPVAVTAAAQNGGMAADGIEDGVMGVIRFASGLLAQFHDAFTTPAAQTGLEVLGTKGALIGSNCLTGNPVGELHLRTAEKVETIPLHHEDLYAGVIKAFHHAVRFGGRPDATGEDGEKAVSVALAAVSASRIHREVSIA